MTERREFTIGLFEIGDQKSCLYSFFCTQCALASSRTQLDGSSCCFNFFCLPVVPYRWLVRSAYDIGDLNACCEDCILSSFCVCCVANQLYQTTSAYGNPSSNGGKAFNLATMSSMDDGNSCYRCLCACCCVPCTQGSVMSKSIGMPYCLAFFCMNPCNVRNFARYQYRLAGDDCMDECFWPSLTIYCGSAAAAFLPCIWCPIAAFFVVLAMQIQLETDRRGGGESKRYLLGYNPPPRAMNGNEIAAAVPVTAIVVSNMYVDSGGRPIYTPSPGTYYVQPAQHLHQQNFTPGQYATPTVVTAQPPGVMVSQSGGPEPTIYPQQPPIVQAYVVEVPPNAMSTTSGKG